MRRILVVLTMALVMAAIMVVIWWPRHWRRVRAPSPTHNCGGTSSFGTRELLGSGQAFGDLVSDFAQVQQADNLTQANCNQNSGQNP